LIEFLSEKGWEAKVASARERLDKMSQDGPSITLAEMLTIADSEHVLASIALAQEYLSQGMPYSALEECYYALQRAPEYLPTHRQLTQILFKMGQTNEAMTKFVAIADLYQVRGDSHQAQAMYERALEMAPMDADVRAKLIDLLVGRGHVDEALEHYMVLADNYYHLAQMDEAREVYEEAMRLAPMGDPQQRWRIRILHKIGDIDMQRVHWREATNIYEQIRSLDATDERARLTLMDLYYRFDRPDLAISELDSLLEIYREQGDMERIFDILEEAVLGRKDDIPLRTRLAQAYLNEGLAEQALKHLDILGDLQLGAGRTKDAKATLRAIVALKPPDVANYQQQLDQLG
jgi:tetratricopeptide (TPR) repeat protein